jgi:antitoxin component of MazEF toxin-antitoxin module
MYHAKFVRSGSTLALEIPEELASVLGLAEGSEVAFEQSQDNAALIIWLSNGHLGGSVDPDRARRIEDIIERRRAMLESLAQR